LLASWGTPPLPYRLGEIYPYDLRVRVEFDIINRVGLTNQFLENTFKQPRVAESRAILESYPRGMVLAERDDPIDEQELDLLNREHEAYYASLGPAQHLRRALAQFLVFALLASMVSLYVARFQATMSHRLSTVMGVCALALGTLALGSVLS